MASQLRYYNHLVINFTGTERNTQKSKKERYTCPKAHPVSRIMSVKYMKVNVL